ncbi:50S ribosomal protein l24 [Grosmannia clavigera kw1407]|uniref:50S ribosomal protein l24 n=1 Tax=Grosmannia clavigera (strain kw1407 / UAMH 11150) TaxID=655863 RepID=F0X7T3_GROCL|nr:50S ribosomal protein l24 [Grosmannia clavigera kw1407]EFX06545.1 50S ribosomal protein l24 [Grosmannia clavigera kw1407]
MPTTPLSLSRAGQCLLDATSSSAKPLLLRQSPWLPHRTSSSSSNFPGFRQQTRGYKQVRLPAGQPPIPSATAQQPEIPPYPLGPRQLYKQSNTGLYGTARIRFGNTVSRQTEIINPQKNRRKWRPNIQEKRLWSASLSAPIRTRISTRVLRTVDKVGGLDEYLLGSKPARIAELGPWGWRLRWRIIQTPAVQERFRRDRIALGLPADGLPADEFFDDTEDASLTAAENEAPVDGTAGQETQRMIDAEELFDLAPDDGFMQEESRPKKP